jgi:DNA-binding LacI/PurR family transcriptional regulator
MPYKFREIVDIVARRIDRGDYFATPFPSEQRLASELGVSYLTARRAVLTLIKEGKLSRDAGGRTKVVATKNSTQAAEPIQIAFVVPNRPSMRVFDWNAAIDKVVAERGGLVRVVPYLHWDDAALYEALTGAYTGVFLVCASEPPRLMRDLFRANAHRIVTIFDDFTELGVPFLDQSSEQGVQIMLGYLRSLGHTHIDCFTAYMPGQHVKAVISRWKEAVEMFGLRGDLHDWWAPEKEPSTAAYEGFTAALRGGKIKATAAICTTVNFVQGVYRAAHDHRLVIGKDISLCAVGSEERARMMIPALTCMSAPDRVPFALRGLEWILTGGKNWNGPIAIRPLTAPLFIGESCSPPAVKKEGQGHTR